MRALISSGLAKCRQVVAMPSTPLAAYARGVLHVDATSCDNRDLGIDALEGAHELREFVCGDLVELDAVNARLDKAHRIGRIGFDEELLLATACLKLGNVGDESIDAALVKRNMLRKYEHGLGKPQAMRKEPPTSVAFVSSGLVPDMRLRVVSTSQRGFSACTASTMARVLVASAL